MRLLVAFLIWQVWVTPSIAADVSVEVLEERAFKEAAALAEPSLVRIETVGGLDQLDDVLLGHGPTTGVIVSADGNIITSSFNFISQPNSILVTLPDGRRLPARIVAHDRVRLMTLLKIDASGLSPARAVAKEKLVVGQWAIALGRTLESSTPSISVGIISALNRVWGKAIQTDAKTSPVNYGGALIDIEGNVMGVIAPLSPNGGSETAGVEWYDGGIGFAIPLEDIYRSLDRLQKGSDLLPGVIGISFSGGQLANQTAIIDRVRFNSPAQRAGLKVNDRIVIADGQSIVRIAQFKNVTGQKYAGETLKLSVQRGEQTIPFEIEMVDKLVPYETPFLGILPQRQADPSGVRIRFVFPGSPAEKNGLVIDDVVTQVNGSRVSDMASLMDLVSRNRPADRITVVVLRNQSEKTIELALGTLPEAVVESLPPELNTAAAVTENAKDPKADGDKPDAESAESDLKAGRFTETLAAHEHEYWAYVPERATHKQLMGLVVWIHPPGDLMEQAIMKDWKAICDRRNLILIAPKAEKLNQWQPGEAEFVKGLIEHFQRRYFIDTNRIIVHSAGNGSLMAWLLTGKYRELIRGTVVVGASYRGPAPENGPDHKQQFFFSCGDADKELPRVEKAIEALRKLKMPVTFQQFEGPAAKYPPEKAIDEIGRWVDSLDRI